MDVLSTGNVYRETPFMPDGPILFDLQVALANITLAEIGNLTVTLSSVFTFLTPPWLNTYRNE